MSYFTELSQYDDNSKDLSPTSSMESTPGSGTKTNPNVALGNKNGGEAHDGPRQKHGRRAARACKSCHSLKVKCTPADENNPRGPCMRCVSSKRMCEIDPNQTRKRRKKVEIQESNNNSFKVMQEETISKLQEQVKSLKQQLGQQLGVGDAASPNVDLDNEMAILCNLNTSKLTVLSNGLKETADRRNSLVRATESIDIIKTGLITIEEARDRLEVYKVKLNTPYCLVEIPQNVTAEELRENQPFLFLAIMSVTNTVYSKNTDLNTTLAIDNAAMQAIVLEVLVIGSKSVELIKSLLMLCLWYNTPELFKNRRNHLLNTLSVSMLHDLGIVGRPNSESGYDSCAMAANTENSGSLEYRRLIMTLYFTTVSICLTLRRRIYVKWTPHVEECCSMLEKSQNPEHTRIALFLRLSHQLEQIYLVVHAPDLSDKKPSFSKYIIRDVQNKLNEIKSNIQKDDHAFIGYYYTVEAYLYEPIFGHIIPSDVEKVSDVVLKSDAINNINYCTNSCLKALREFNNMSTDSLATLPLIYGSRIIYTVGILLKLRYLMLSIPSLHDLGLVPESIIFTIQKLTESVDQSNILNPFNHILKKTRLVLQLFIQAYASQIHELFKRQSGNQDMKNKACYPRKELSEIERLSKMFKKNGSGNLLPTVSGDSYQSQVPLDILSYAASFRKSFPNEQNYADHRHSQSVPPPTQPLTLINQIPHTYSSTDLNTNIGMNNLSSVFNNNTNPVPQNPTNNLGSLQNHNSMGDNSDLNLTNNNINVDNTNSNDANFNTSVVNPDQLENLYDEFWSDLINADSDKINFANYSNSTAPVYDEVFFMP